MNQMDPAPTRRRGARAARRRRRLGALALVLLAQAMFALPAAAAHVEPTFLPGNPDCGDVISGDDIFELKIQPVEDGTYPGPEGFSVTIEVNETDQTFDWTANHTVLVVVVKGGPNANLYDYQPLGGETGDTGLHAPDNPNNDKFFGLSHISFCYQLAPSTELTVDSVSPNTTIIEGFPATIRWAETNDGDFDLTNPSVTADNDCTPAFESGDDGDGILNVGETWIFACTVSPTSTTTYTAIGHGFHDGDEVTWCDDPGNPPADTICDQDEIAQQTITVVEASTDLDVGAGSHSGTIIAGTTVTLQFTETNDGDVDLANADVLVNNGCNTSLVSGDDGDGILEPLETWVFECDVAPNASTTYTAIGTGEVTGLDGFNGIVVTWCADPNNPPANTICDQDERAQTTITVVNPSTDLDVSATDPGPVAPGTVVTLTWDETNDGDADLDNVDLAVTEGAAACTLVGPTGDNGDGILNQGETWTWTCDVTVNALTTVTAVATGTTIDPAGTIVTWCADPGNPPPNTLCNANETASITIDVLEIGEGCTPGFWRQFDTSQRHADAWAATGYSPDDLFSSVFENAFPGKTLGEVVKLGGGGLNALGRHTVAALLNAASPDVDYGMTEAEVIAAFNDVFPGSTQDYNELKNEFVGLNEAGCPI